MKDACWAFYRDDDLRRNVEGVLCIFGESVEEEGGD
jgi:hypothetical protein